MGQSYISTEHLLLGIVREGDGTALEVLGRLGVSGDNVRSALNDLVGQSPVYAGRNAFDPMGGSSDSMLKEFGTDLTKKASEGKLDPVIGRAGEIERVMQVLSRRQKNNPLLIGEPGVGKTAVIEGLAQLIVANQVPDLLRNKRLVTLDVSALVAGQQVPRRIRGTPEEMHQGGAGRGRRDPVHRRDPHHHRRRLGGRLHRRGRHPEAAAVARRDPDHRRHHSRRVPQALREGFGPRPAFPAHHRGRAERGTGHPHHGRPARPLRGAPSGALHRRGAAGGCDAFRPLHPGPLSARQGHRRAGRGGRAHAHPQHDVA